MELEGAVLDHVGLAVRSIEDATRVWIKLGFRLVREETVKSEGVRVAMMEALSGRVELLEAVEGASAVARFVARRGEGMHHLAWRVENVDACFEQMQAEGVRLASARIGVGAGGHRYFFLHPESAGGVLVEVVGA